MSVSTWSISGDNDAPDPDADRYRGGTVFPRELILCDFQSDALGNLQGAGLIALHQTDHELLTLRSGP